MVQSTARSTPTVIVGVVGEQPSTVFRMVAEFAALWGAHVICAHVDTGRFVTGTNGDGSVNSLPIDPDLEDRGTAPFPAKTEAALDASFTHGSFTWETRELVGEPAQALADLADETDAAMIIVGTRRPGFRGVMREFLDGSVAVHLAHRQHRPVLVIPQSPTTHGALPWENLA